jgi:tyrosinase
MPSHAIVHIVVGGDMYIFFGSSSDPLFFVHHSFIDMQWAISQSTSASNAMAYDGRKHDRTVS